MDNYALSPYVVHYGYFKYGFILKVFELALSQDIECILLNAGKWRTFR